MKKKAKGGSEKMLRRKFFTIVSTFPARDGTFLKYIIKYADEEELNGYTEIVWNVLFHLIQSMGGVGIVEERFMHANNRKIIYCCTISADEFLFLSILYVCKLSLKLESLDDISKC